jgi:polysaccharide biosynthesis protein PelA
VPWRAENYKENGAVPSPERRGWRPTLLGLIHRIATVRLLLIAPFFLAWQLAHAVGNVAFYYGEHPPWDELAAFDIVVVEPDHVRQPPVLNRTKLFAYLSVGEVNASRHYARLVPESWRRGTNPGWGNMLIDQSQPAWPAFLIEHAVRPLWARGYRGFFFDTLDSFELYAKTPGEKAAQVAGMVRVVEAIKREFPSAELVLNRGFELLPAVKQHVLAVAAESIYAGWDPTSKIYREVPAAWREPLLEKLRVVRNTHQLPVIAIDYVPPGERVRAREIAERIKALGFIPWVANPSLDMLGVGAIEVVPRKILMLYNSGRNEQSLIFEYVAMYGAMPLNWFGYVPQYHEVSHGALPNHPLAGRYAGIVTWFQDDLGRNAQAVSAFLQQARQEGVRIAVLGQFGLPPGGNLNTTFGVNSRLAAAPAAVRFEHRIGLGFEFDPPADRRLFFPLAATGADVPVRLVSDRGETMDAVAFTAWGGYALNPYAITNLPEANRARWALDPFEFFRRSLDLPPIPMPDVTTENGRRLLLVHIDGDGFANRAEFTPPAVRRNASTATQQGTFAAEVLLRDVLERYRIPTTMSIIQGEVGPNGLYPNLSPALENIARDMFRLPHVEIGSHSYSHPFRWGGAAGGEQGPIVLPIRNYRFDLATEVDGSIRYIEERLAPPGKKVRLFQWTGDCNPGADALARVHAIGVANINGGETLMSRAEPSVTLVAPLGVPKGGQFQVFAPNQNENRYTNSFRGPFAGYQRAIETFQMTEAPRRLKPINIYYHTFSASKRASLAALHRVYDWVLTQDPHPIHAAEYAAKVHDFNRMVVARKGNGYLIRGAGELRTVRIPDRTAYPDFATSQGIAGYADHEGERYIHLAGSEATLAFTGTPPRVAMLAFANGRIEQLGRANATTTLTLRGHVPLKFALSNAERCAVRSGDTRIAPVESTAAITIFNLEKHGATRATVECRD